VGEKGHYYHENLIFPSSLRLLSLKPGDSLIDLGCGQGVLCGQIPKQVAYTGVDAAPSLIQKAKQRFRGDFLVADLTKPLNLNGFSHAAMILVLQNIEEPEMALQNAAKALKPGGKFLLVLNHPCFRIPRQSSLPILRSLHSMKTNNQPKSLRSYPKPPMKNGATKRRTTEEREGSKRPRRERNREKSSWGESIL